jgi:hypothetical protein
VELIILYFKSFIASIRYTIHYFFDKKQIHEDEKACGKNFAKPHNIDAAPAPRRKKNYAALARYPARSPIFWFAKMGKIFDFVKLQLLPRIQQNGSNPVMALHDIVNIIGNIL